MSAAASEILNLAAIAAYDIIVRLPEMCKVALVDG